MIVDVTMPEFCAGKGVPWTTAVIHSVQSVRGEVVPLEPKVPVRVALEQFQIMMESV